MWNRRSEGCACRGSHLVGRLPTSASATLWPVPCSTKAVSHLTGAASPSTAVANLVGSLAVLVSTLFGGFLLSRKQMPPVVGWLARLSFVRCVC